MIERSCTMPSCAEALRVYAAPSAELAGARSRTLDIVRMPPYMYDSALLPTLGKIRLPTLVIWCPRPDHPHRIMVISINKPFQGHAAGDRPLPLAPFRQPETLAEIIREFTAG
jgi:hypothetical protein